MNVKLTKEKVDEIRNKYIPYKISMQMLADEYGVSKSAIEFVIQKRRWV